MGTNRMHRSPRGNKATRAYMCVWEDGESSQYALVESNKENVSHKDLKNLSQFGPESAQAGRK